MGESSYRNRRPTNREVLAIRNDQIKREVGRAQSRELAATRGVADGVEESIELWFCSRGAVQSAVVLIQRGYDVESEATAYTSPTLGGVMRRDLFGAMLKRGVVAIDGQSATAIALPLDYSVMERRHSECLCGPNEQERCDQHEDHPAQLGCRRAESERSRIRRQALGVVGRDPSLTKGTRTENRAVAVYAFVPPVDRV